MKTWPFDRTSKQNTFLRPNTFAKDFAVLEEAAPSAYTKQGSPPSSHVVSLLYVALSTVLFCLASVCVRMNTVVPAVEISFFRSVFSVGVGVMLCRTVYTEPILPFQTSNTTMTLLVIRGLTDYLASTLFYFGCAQLGLGLATLITFTNPFWAAILAKLWLGEPYGLKDFTLASVAFVGIACATLPNLQSESMKTVNLGMIVLVSLRGVLQACTYCLIKRIHGEVHFM